MPRALTVNSDAAGDYRFAQAPAAHGYTLTVTPPGFRNGQSSRPERRFRQGDQVEVKLEVGQVTESVVVSGRGVMVDTQYQHFGRHSGQVVLRQLPKGRSFYDLIGIAPGRPQRGEEQAVTRWTALPAPRTPTTWTAWKSRTSRRACCRTRIKIPVEMVQQVQIKNGVMEAQYGGAMGGVVNAVAAQRHQRLPRRSRLLLQQRRHAGPAAAYPGDGPDDASAR